MIILGVYNSHDACATLFDDYRLIAAVALERPSRVKSDGYRWPAEAVSECLDQAGLRPAQIQVVALSRAGYPKSYYHDAAFTFGDVGRGEQRDLFSVLNRRRLQDPERVFDVRRLMSDNGVNPERTFFYNHHAAHAFGTLFHTDWDDALLYTSDGGGDGVYYSARRFIDGKVEELFGGETDARGIIKKQRRQDSLGLMYYHVTEALGFRPMRHEGKVLGLAAFGEPVYQEELSRFWRLDRDGQIRGRKLTRKIRETIYAIAKKGRREDLAASAQAVLEDITIDSLSLINAHAPSKNLGLSGGVFANVKLTQRIAERFPFKEIFVCPAMSDQGEAEGGALEYLLERDGLKTWLSKRERWGNLYLGRDYMNEADAIFEGGGAHPVGSSDVADTVSKLIIDGGIVGTYLGRCEYGPRALGARSIMASPTDRTINDTLNNRLDRTEFMPFAPVVREERVQDVFELPASLHYTARFMTVTCDVKPEWRDKIPAVVHVDGTARPQIVRRVDNPVYYGILEAYERATGIPVLINTSFNVHEEPIVNHPREALKALASERVDFVVTDRSVWAMPTESQKRFSSIPKRSQNPSQSNRARYAGSVVQDDGHD